MRYLKSFNEETNFKFEDELKEFCELNLVYLIDEGLEVHVDYSHSMKDRKHGYAVIIDLIEPKKWNDIKDHMIPFLIRLNNRYELDKVNWDNDTVNKNVKINYFIGGSLSVMRIFQNLKDLVDESNETLWINYKLYDIRLYIKGYKKENKKGILTKIKSFFK